MQIYKVFDSADEETTPLYAGSMNEAHTHAKCIASRKDARIELLEIPTDKAAILMYLNVRRSDATPMDPLRTWVLTDRGGLKEIANGE